jgi:hypothetical protein
MYIILILKFDLFKDHNYKSFKVKNGDITIMEVSIHSITEQMVNLIHTEVTNKIKYIAENEGLDSDYLIKKYLSSININSYKQIKKRERKLPPKELQCKGRKCDFTQCTRKKKDGTEFCQSHLKNLKYGRVDDENEEYVPMWEEDINGVTYLIDNEDLVYTNDIKSPELLGKKDNNGNILYLGLDE